MVHKTYQRFFDVTVFSLNDPTRSKIKLRTHSNLNIYTRPKKSFCLRKTGFIKQIADFVANFSSFYDTMKKKKKK